MRKPAVAGSFYPGSLAGLQRQIEDCFKHPLGPGALPGEGKPVERHTLGLVSPHAGYIYSGPVAANGFFWIAAEKRPGTVVIVGPNHRGLGAAVAVGRERTWQTPLGTVEVDVGMGEAIVAAGHWAKWDDLAHSMEHSLEVQVPFLQYIYGSEFRIVPIAMLRQELEIAQDLGRAIAATLKGKDGLVIASSDFSHYESQASAGRAGNGHDCRLQGTGRQEGEPPASCHVGRCHRRLLAGRWLRLSGDHRLSGRRPLQPSLTPHKIATHGGFEHGLAFGYAIRGSTERKEA
jgi:AmmeMemoRadiSam system protein B